MRLLNAHRGSMAAALACVPLLAALPSTARAEASWLRGNLSNITSTSAGLLIRLDNGRPDNCAADASGWMIISKDDRTMIATVLLSYAMGKRGMDIYTAPPVAGNYCPVTQVDPIE